MDPTFFTGRLTAKEAVDALAQYNEYRPHLITSGYGVLTQNAATISAVEPMTLIEAEQYANETAVPFGPALIVPVTSNVHNAYWVWGCWLACPNDHEHTDVEEGD